MTNFVCMECGYKFKSEKEKQKKCPYCAGNNIEREKTAEELVDTITRE